MIPVPALRRRHLLPTLGTFTPTHDAIRLLLGPHHSQRNVTIRTTKRVHPQPLVKIARANKLSYLTRVPRGNLGRSHPRRRTRRRCGHCPKAQYCAATSATADSTGAYTQRGFVVEMTHDAFGVGLRRRPRRTGHCGRRFSARRRGPVAELPGCRRPGRRRPGLPSPRPSPIPAEQTRALSTPALRLEHPFRCPWLCLVSCTCRGGLSLHSPSMRGATAPILRLPPQHANSVISVVRSSVR